MKRVGFLLNSQIFAAHHQRLDSMIVLHRCQLLRTSAGYLRWEKGGKTDVWFLLVAHSQTGKSTKSTDGWTIEHSSTLLGWYCAVLYFVVVQRAKYRRMDNRALLLQIYMLVQCREPKAISNRLIDHFQQYILSHVKELTVDPLFCLTFWVNCRKTPSARPLLNLAYSLLFFVEYQAPYEGACFSEFGMLWIDSRHIVQQ